MSATPCPRCGTSVTELQNLDAALISKINEGGNTETLPSQVCSTCFSQLAGSVARGSILMAREKAKEQKRLMLWKSRVNLIKKARMCMSEKMFSDAAVSYEKYFRVLEMVFDVQSGGLTPEHFKDSARTQELTVVASAYWDLLRIYDTSSKYGERQSLAAKKLGIFLRYTPIYPDIMRKAEIFAKQCKNPEVVKNFVKSASEQKGRCFIASSAYESEYAPEVVFLQHFRDHHLLKVRGGKILVDAYYSCSPAFARILDKSASLRKLVRLVLNGIIRFLPSVNR